MNLNVRTVFFLNGIILCGISMAMCIPVIYDISVAGSECVEEFRLSIVACLFFGVSLILSCKDTEVLPISQKDVYLIILCFWILVSFCSSFPFLLYRGNRLDLASALFEAVSGITVTGASVYSDVESLPAALNLWRFILHFIGGIGIVTIAMLVMPRLRGGGMQLFQTENSDRTQRVLPRTSQIVAVFIFTCAFIVAITSVCLYLAGMSKFDAICHGISAIMTGGFSTKNNGIAYYDNRNIEIIVGAAMFVGGITFMEIISSFRNGFKNFFRNQQIIGYMKLFFLFVILSIALYFFEHDKYISPKMIVGLFFQTASSLSTTGFDLISNNIAPYWKLCFIILLAFGGCSGSTSGGIKIFRLQIFWRVLRNYIRRQASPHTVEVPKYNNQIIDMGIISSIITYLSLLVIFAFISTLLISILTSYDLNVCLSATCSCIFNSGCSIDYYTKTIVTFYDMTPMAKYILMFDMLIGRLEIIPIFVILNARFLKNY